MNTHMSFVGHNCHSFYPLKTMAAFLRQFTSSCLNKPLDKLMTIAYKVSHGMMKQC